MKQLYEDIEFMWTSDVPSRSKQTSVIYVQVSSNMLLNQIQPHEDIAFQKSI